MASFQVPQFNDYTFIEVALFSDIENNDQHNLLNIYFIFNETHSNALIFFTYNDAFPHDPI